MILVLENRLFGFHLRRCPAAARAGLPARV